MNKSIVKPCSASKGLRFWCNFIPFEQRTSTGLQFYSASRFICVALFYSSHIESWVMSSICKWHMLEICLEVILTFLGLVKSPDLINDYHQNNFLEVFPWCLGKPSFKKSAVFLNIPQKAFDPPLPPFVWTSCRICSECREWKFDIMYLFYPQISPSMPQKSLFMQISCC